MIFAYILIKKTILKQIKIDTVTALGFISPINGETNNPFYDCHTWMFEN